MVYPAGGHPIFHSSTSNAPVEVDPTSGEQAEPVHGHRAFWLRSQKLYQYPVQRLACEWADGSWAFAAVGGSDSEGVARDVPVSTLRTEARRLALASTVGMLGRCGCRSRCPPPRCRLASGSPRPR